MTPNLDTTTWPPQTKLYSPQPRADILARASLISRLDEYIFHHRLTLISTQAGAGKTILLATWLQQVDTACATAWLRTDQDDNDPTTFLAGLLARTTSDRSTTLRTGAHSAKQYSRHPSNRCVVLLVCCSMTG